MNKPKPREPAFPFVWTPARSVPLTLMNYAAGRTPPPTYNDLRRYAEEQDAEIEDLKRELDTTQSHLDGATHIVEKCDEIGSFIAKWRGTPYDRATCWGEPAIDLAEEIVDLLRKERDGQ